MLPNRLGGGREVFRDRFVIATGKIIEAADDVEAEQQAREILARDDDRCRAVEVWNREQKVYLYPSDAEQPTFVAMMRIALMHE